MEGNVSHKFMNIIEAESELYEVIDYLYNHPNTKFSGISLAKSFSVNRLTFSVSHLRKDRKIIKTIEDIVRITGFKDYLNIILETGSLIKKTLGTVLNPVHLVGVGFDKKSIKQLKVYYRFGIFDEDEIKKECIMGRVDNELYLKSVKDVLQELDCEEQFTKVERVFQLMTFKNFELEFIGLNIEKNKQPSLKLYFQPNSFIKQKRQK